MLTNIFQPTHLIIVLAVALLILGPKRLPEAGRALGQGLKEFKSSISPAHGDHPDDEISAAPGSTPEI
ncbi:MAG TPA: twin-arginine translocase TatA/TatE family subunit [Solirubrobacteraceae bacterium]|nr:twin-arginine translocase TatA/TatE family subunit [Solirubrobacteraceae bacterium]